MFRLFPQGPLLFICFDCFLRVRFCLYVSLDLIEFQFVAEAPVAQWGR